MTQAVSWYESKFSIEYAYWVTAVRAKYVAECIIRNDKSVFAIEKLRLKHRNV
jgi:hypothetical protein